MDITANPIGAHSVDVHAHYFGTDLAHRLAVAPDDRWPTLVTDGEVGQIMLGDKVFRNVRSVLWDVTARIIELDRAGVDLQVISPVPVTLAYWADETAAVDYSRASNESIADAVARSEGRLAGLGTVPLPHVDAAVAELHRLLALGLRGVQIGTQIAGVDLDAPELDPFFATAEILSVAVFVHPTDGGGGVIRRSGQPYDFGLGMVSDTAIAATALVFGGVLAKYPRLRVGLAHGCGTFAAAYPRLRLGAQIFDDVDPAEVDRLVSSLWVDSLVFDPGLLRPLADCFGGEHLLLGTDYPFVPGQIEGHREFLSAAVGLGALTRSDAARVSRSNAMTFLGLGGAQ